MKKKDLKILKNTVIGVCLFLLALFGYDTYNEKNQSPDGVRIPVNLVKIVDGDTVKVKIDDNQFSVRLIGIDCFETSDNKRAYKQSKSFNIPVSEVYKRGISSKKYLEDLYYKSDRNVYLDFRGLDVYGRALGIIYFGDENINRKLLNSGGCVVYK